MSTMATPVRRYPASLSHNSSGPSRPPRPHSQPQSSIDDEVPAPPDPLPPAQQLPELASLEHLLQQAGYKETRVFTPENERVRRRLKVDFDEDSAAELAHLYSSMGLDARGPMQVQHLTKPGPYRSSSSVLRSVVLQDASSAINEKRRDINTAADASPEAAQSWWTSTLLGRAAQTVGKGIASMSPPNDQGSLEASTVGLGLAKGGQFVRKTKSNWELGLPYSVSPPQQEDIPPRRVDSALFSKKPAAPPAPPSTRVPTAFTDPPPSIAALFSPPEENAAQFEDNMFDDDAFGFSPLPSDYEAQEDEDMYTGYDDDYGYESSSTLGASPPTVDAAAEIGQQPMVDFVSPAVNFDDETLADPEEILQAEREAAAIGKRILAATVEYDDDDSDDEVDLFPPPKAPVFTAPAPAVVPPPIPIVEIEPPSPPKATASDRIAQAMAEMLVEPTVPLPVVEPVAVVVEPVVVGRAPLSKLRAAQSTPALGRASGQRSNLISRRPPFRITPASAAAPTLQRASPVICDSVSNDAEDLPPLPPAPAAPVQTNFSSIALRARKSLTSLRAAFWAEPVPALEPTETVDDELPRNTATPILTPRLDWQLQGAHFAGWSSDSDDKPKHSSSESTDSTGTVRELGDPFADQHVEIDYTKSFFYKPATPPRPNDDGRGSSSGGHHSGQPRKQRSVKSLRAALLIPVAPPPVPPLPPAYRKSAGRDGTRTPPRDINRHVVEPPVIAIHSPGAWEEGRPARQLVLEGEEWDGHDVVSNWGSGVRRRSGKGKSKRSKASKSRLSNQIA
ncbi:hypothetical protein Q8F55_004210 [Vanrija albida]|uniref:UBA domain-containing protein n=1 Tax=Vanrija albida TaxID=181172 RepID=A0ABR3Q636_9TREE